VDPGLRTFPNSSSAPKTTFGSTSAHVTTMSCYWGGCTEYMQLRIYHLPYYECGSEPLTRQTHSHYAMEGREKCSKKELQTSEELCQCCQRQLHAVKPDGKLVPHQESGFNQSPGLAGGRCAMASSCMIGQAHVTPRNTPFSFQPGAYESTENDQEQSG